MIPIKYTRLLIYPYLNQNAAKVSLTINRTYFSAKSYHGNHQQRNKPNANILNDTNSGKMQEQNKDWDQNQNHEQGIGREKEMAKYDQLIKQAVHQSIGNSGTNTNVIGGTSYEFATKPLSSANFSEPSKRLPLRTILFLIAVSSTLSMLLYSVVQYIKFESDTMETNGKLRLQSIFFLPLWFNTNILSKKTYKYPYGIRYLDPEYYEYLVTEIAQFNQQGSGHLTTSHEVENFVKSLELNNVYYGVLEKISANKKIRELFGLPLVLESRNKKDQKNLTNPINFKDNDFKIWVEVKHPSVSGLQIELAKFKDQSSQIVKKNITFNWTVKPINWRAITDNVLTSLGIGLNKLETSNANIKIHEDSSGRIHEVQQEKDKHQVIQKNRDYEINFKNEINVMNKSGTKTGVVRYQGHIDFDHLLINKGVKITRIDLVFEDTVYRIA